MITHVRFTQPFTFAGTVSMVTYNFNASPNVDGYLDDALAQALVMLGLAIEVI